MNKKVSLTVVLAAVILLISGTFVLGANEKALHATGSDCDCLYIVNLTTGDTVFIGELGPSFLSPTNMAVDLDGTLFAVDNSTGELVTLDKATGKATVVGSGLGVIHGLAINPLEVPGPGASTFPEGTLFGATSTDLVVIDKTDASVEVIGSIGFTLAGLAFNSNGALFGAELSTEFNGQLVSISTETGVGEALGTIGPDVDRMGSLTFTSDGRLLGSDFGTFGDRIFEIDPCNGSISNILDVDNSPQGMEFAFQIINTDDPDEERNNQFGWSVSGGASVIVGAPFSDLAPDAGEAFVFSGDNLRNVTVLSDPDPEEGAQFGYSVSTGASVIVGAPFSDLAPDAGEAFVFSGEEYDSVITLSDPTPERGARFGWSVSGGASVIVGAPFSDLAPDAGEAFVFSGEEYDSVITLSDPSPERGARFGWSVSGGASVIVGAPFSDLAPDAGEAFVFSGEEYDSVITLSDPEPERGARFGWSVSGGASVIVGAPFSDLDKDAGQAFVFKGDEYEIVITLNPPDPERGAQFGFSVSTAGDWDGDGNTDVIVGAPFADVIVDNKTLKDAGKAYIFLGPDFTEVIILISPEPQARAHFGRSVSSGIDGVIAGAPNLDSNLSLDVGQATFFQSAGTPPTQVGFDIKPQSCPNPFNIKDNGVTRFAILGSTSFDVNDIDTETILFEGVPPFDHFFADKATSTLGDCFDCNDKGHDGFLDLILRYNVQDIVCVLGEVKADDRLCMTITGKLLDGTPFEGNDAVTIVDQEGGGPQSEGPAANLPTVFSLHQNYPNPFSSATSIRYALPTDSKVSLKIYDITGRVVRTLVDEEQKAQFYTINWDGRDNMGVKAASGIYFTRMVSGKFVATQKTVLLK
jgi:hypothetical protein